MTKYTIHSEINAGLSHTVEVDDGGEFDLQKVFDAAFDDDQAPTGICAQCSGWGAPWSRDEGDPVEYEVTDESGNVVWSAEGEK